MLLILLLAMGALAAGGAPERYTLCGRELARAHALYCYGVEPHPEAVEHNSPLSKGMQGDIIEVPKLPERFAYRGRRAAAVKLQERTPSLVEECCLKPCHVDELISHC